ncbi:MAG: hypothetical protein ABI882_14115 [Acidobacteriota bacterium]
MSCRDKVETIDAPARINILGEHVDYVSYVPTASLTFGSDLHRMVMRFKSRLDDDVRGSSDRPEFEPFVFRLPGSTGSALWSDYLYSRPPPDPHWSNYVRGAIAYAVWKYGPSLRRGFEFWIGSNIPACGGASSSSALTVLAGAAIRRVNDIEIEPEELARDSARAEWFTGTRGGDMDHLTICLAHDAKAVHLNYSEPSWSYVDLPSRDVRWVTCFSHPADKGSEVMIEYNERAAVARIIIPALLADGVSVEELPQSIRLDGFAQGHPVAMEQCRQAFPALVRERATRPIAVRDRALHHRHEILRVERAISLLRAFSAHASRSDWNALGAMLDLSHASLRDLYQVSTPEVDSLYEIIREMPGVFGARLMGGGFGGNILALLTADGVEEFTSRLQSAYYEPRGRNAMTEGAIMISAPGPGVSLAKD